MEEEDTREYKITINNSEDDFRLDGKLKEKVPILVSKNAETGSAMPETVEPPLGKWDYVMVFSIANRNKAIVFRKRLEHANLITKTEISRDGDEVTLYISATLDVFENKAQKLKMKKKLRKEYGGTIVKFSIQQREKFEGSEDPLTFFTSYERAQIIFTIIEARQTQGGAHIKIHFNLENGNLSSCFPLHEEETRSSLKHAWLSKRSLWDFRVRPIEEMRSYFGEYIAMYFAWLDFYTKWLAFPAVLGTLMIIVIAIAGFDNRFVPFYCIFVGIWATFFLEFWKRKNAAIVTKWGVKDYVEEEKVRSSFKGELRYGVYVQGEFISLDPDAEPFKWSNDSSQRKTPPRTLWAPKSVRWLKFGAGLSLLVTFCFIVVIATFGVFIFKLYMRHIFNKYNTEYGGTAAGIVTGVANALTILALNLIYRKVAFVLTEWENHRLTSEWESSFVVKSFLFQFVNSYISLYYVAFMKGRVTLIDNGIFKEKCQPDCMTELGIQLGTIFMTNLVVGQINEALIPWIKAKAFVYWESTRLRSHKEAVYRDANQAEVECKLTPVTSIFDEYNEMAIQWGYLTLFATAFPPAPLAAMLNNVIEIRSDSLKMLTSMQRPHPRSAVDIGVWYEIMEIISYLAVISNSAIVVFTSTEIDEMWPGLTFFDKLWIAVIAEHIFFLVKWIIARFIPDVPQWIRKLQAKQTYYQKVALKEDYLDDEEINEVLEDLDNVIEENDEDNEKDL